MKNAIVAIIILIVMFVGIGFLSFRIGVEKCQRNIAEETVKIQQVVQESDRTITEKVLSTSHADNLMFLLSSFKRAD